MMLPALVQMEVDPVQMEVDPMQLHFVVLAVSVA